MKRNLRDFLYVPRDELDEARSLGAVHILGDSRLVIPRPLPVGIEKRSFHRWQGNAARYRWCAEFISSLLSDVLRGKPGIDEMLAAMRGGKNETDERVYLYVTKDRSRELRGLPGVKWDRRRQMWYALKEAKMGELFEFLTPAAMAAWRAERATIVSLNALVRERARIEKSRRDGASDGGLETTELERPHEQAVGRD